MSVVRLAVVIVSLAVIGFLISPLSPLVLGKDTVSPGPSTNEPEEIIDESKIAPAEITPADFDECNSINDDVQRLMASSTNSTSKTAADLLTGEYCNRPDLVHEISAAADPGVSLVAYACDASSGKIGDSALQDSLADHGVVYCEVAGNAVTTGTDDLKSSINGFRTDFVANMTSVQSEDGSAVYSTEQINTELDHIISMTDEALALMDQHRYYDSTKSLAEASAAFDALLEKIENA